MLSEIEVAEAKVTDVIFLNLKRWEVYFVTLLRQKDERESHDFLWHYTNSGCQGVQYGEYWM